MDSRSILIIGGGLGGLCLAQGLKRAGIPFLLFERDRSVDSRTQGYRLRIDAAGQDALARCLPVDLLYLLHQSASLTDGEPWFVDSRLRSITMPAPESWATPGEGSPDLCVHRRTLREILQCGLAGHVRFGHALDDFETRDGSIVARFTNGEEARGAILVGADGIGSVVRRQIFPDLVPEDTGYACIYGRTPVTPENCQAIGRDLCAGTSVVFADGFSAIIDVMAFREPMPALASRIAPDCRPTPVDDYFYWALTGPRSRLGLPSLADDITMLAAFIGRLIHEWDPRLQALFLRGDPADWRVQPIHSLLPERTGFPETVTLLGDAAHVMSPAGGLGASTALQDAADLVAQLGRVRPATIGGSVLRPYERIMHDRAMEAVARSLAGNERLAAPVAA